MKTQNKQNTEKWISAVLLNDEESTDQEIKEYFKQNGLTEEESLFYLNQRNEAFLNPLDFELKVYGFKFNYSNKERAVKLLEQEKILNDLGIRRV